MKKLPPFSLLPALTAAVLTFPGTSPAADNAAWSSTPRRGPFDMLMAAAPRVAALEQPIPAALTGDPLPSPTPPAVVIAAVAPSPTPVPPPAAPAPMPPKDGILLNFQGASLTDVLNYLSEAAGFVIVQEAPVTGTVNVVSRQPVSPAEAVDLVNAVLVEKGYVALRSGRILKIVSRAGAQKRDLPVATGSDPERIPRKDEMVTQILPLRFGEAAKLMENLRPLLSDTAIINANESSNAILLTDTQTNVRRVAQIIQAIDTSVSAISTVRVFPLNYADSKAVATLLTQLFANSSSSGGNQQGGNRGGGNRGGFPGGPGGGQQQPAAPQSEARQAASRVVALADEQSNSVVISAPEESMPTIQDIIKQVDTSIKDITENRIFRLQHADSVELAATINSLYGDPTTQGAVANRTQGGGQNNNRQGGQQGGFGGGGQPAPAAASGARSERALLQSRVLAVGDPRTNSLIVTAARDSMAQISEMVGRLDSTDAKKQRVYVHSLQHADANTIAAVLRGMLGQGGASTQNEVNRLTDRTASGATTSATQSSTGLGGGGTTGR